LLNISAGTSGILWDLELGFKRNLSSRLWKIMSLVENILRDVVQVQRTSNLRNPPCATPNVHAVPGPTPEKHYRKAASPGVRRGQRPQCPWDAFPAPRQPSPGAVCYPGPPDFDEMLLLVHVTLSCLRVRTVVESRTHEVPAHADRDVRADPVCGG
jgi:hypothetical protein